MKNKIAYLLFFMVAVASVSCNKKFLEEMKSYDDYDESMFGNEVLTGYYIDRLYNYYFAAYKNPMLTVVGSYTDTRRNLTEEIGGQNPFPDYINPNKTLMFASDGDPYYGGTTSTLPASVSNNPYTRIRNANFLIQKVDEVGGSTLSEDFRKTAKGQMFFFRGLQYFDLVRVYGGVPLVLTVQNASANDEAIRYPRAKTSEVFDQIAKDFDSAAALLPATWASSTTNYGRFTAGAALAMKSRALLTAASPLFNTDWDNPGNAKWQKALAAGLAAEAALTTAGYGNAITNAKQWAEVTFANDNSFNGEGVFVNLLSNATTGSGVNNNSWENSLRIKDQGGTNGISAPKDMIDLFPMADGTRPTAANGYDETFFFAKRDPRFYRTFAFSGAKWPYKGNQNYVTWLYRWKTTAGVGTYYGGNSLSSPAVVRKMSNPNADNTGYQYSGTDIFDYRFGELLLNIAECYAATGDNDKCIEYLSRIRKRVGISSGNNYGLGNFASRYAALEACLYERRVELAYEGKRFWDLQRWMLYDDEGTDNTNAKLNIQKLNGTNRSGYYWQAKSGVTSDPLTAADRASIVIDPDASDFSTQIDKLKTLYTTKFEKATLDNAMDRDGTTPVNILFKPNYYLAGITGGILSNNPWLLQTKGWQDYSGVLGTFNYQE